MRNDIDREELEIFLEEFAELRQVLEEDLLNLERNPGDGAVVRTIFRAAHTIKGNAGAMGFTTMSKLAHSMEAIFDRVRKGTLSVTPELTDTFFVCMDTMRSLGDEISENLEENTDISEVLKALEDSARKAAEESGGGDEAVQEKEKSSASESKAGGPGPGDAGGRGGDGISARTLSIKLDVAEDCALPVARAMQVFSMLSKLGSIIAATPSLEEIKNKKKSFPLEIKLATEAGRQKVEQILELVTDVRIVLLAESPGEARGASLEKPGAGKEIAVTAPPEPPPSQEKAGARDAGAATGAGAKPGKKQSPRSIRVDVGRMDRIMDLVGELVINRTRLSQLSRALEPLQESDENVEFLSETADNIEMISSQLQEHVMNARLLPIDNIFTKFPRMVRDLARKSGKEIKLNIKGSETELDRSVLEELGDPLMHVLRNAVDHGIEGPEQREAAGKPRQGTINVAAEHVEDHIHVTVEDDGGGIDPVRVYERAKSVNLLPDEALEAMNEKEVLDLVFRPGFSTREKATEISGRGVGMDVLRSNIERLNGSVSLDTRPGGGTRVLIVLPLTLAIIRALLVTFENRIFAVPISSVVQTVRIQRKEIQSIKGRDAIYFRGGILSLVTIGEVFSIERGKDQAEPDKFFVVVLSWSGRRLGLVVDGLIGDQEIVVRPLGEYIGEVECISGATILGDGKIALILDSGGIVEKGSIKGTAKEAALGQAGK